MGRLAFHTADIGWTPLGAALPEAGPGELAGLEALVEAPDAVYAAGWKGELWRLEHERWTQLASPTKYILTGGTTLPSGDVLFCGRMGTLVTGRGDAFRLVPHGKTEDDFWSVTIFQGRIFVASLLALFELKGDQLSLVEGLETPNHYHLASNDSLLLSVGSSTLAVFENGAWTELL